MLNRDAGLDQPRSGEVGNVRSVEVDSDGARATLRLCAAA